MSVHWSCIPSFLSFSQQPCPLPFRSNFLPTQIIGLRDIKRTRIPLMSCITRPPILPSSFGIGTGDAFGFRVFVLSDLHTDYHENMTWIKSLPSNTYNKNDVLLVVGDVAETYANFFFTMSLLKYKFRYVFFVPGNHDLWCRWDQDHCPDSLAKLNKLLDACRALGVETNPAIIHGLGIIPLFSWYHESFDTEKDITGIRIPSLEMAKKLSSKDTSLALYFDSMNDGNDDKIKLIQKSCSQIITFSHFVPRYVQAPLAYPRERKRMNGGETWLPFCIYSDGKFAERLAPCHWSDY